MGLSTPPVRFFESVVQGPPVAGTLFTWGHGLGAKPRHFDLYFVCMTADIGWSTNEEVLMPWMESTGNYSGGLWADASNVYYVVGLAGVLLPNKSTGQAVSPILANWRMRVRASL